MPRRSRPPGDGRERRAGKVPGVARRSPGRFFAEVRGAERVVRVDNEQYVDSVRARFGMALLGSRVEYRRMDALSASTLCGWRDRARDLRFALADAAAIEVHEPGDVYARDDFVHWGFSPEGLQRLGRIVGLDEFGVVDDLEIDGDPILALLRAAG